MIIITRKNAAEESMDMIKEYLVNKGFDFHQSTGANRTIIGVIGNTETLDEKKLSEMPGVHQVVRIIPEDKN